MRKVTVAATQFHCGASPEGNLEQAERLIREAAEKGANLILLQSVYYIVSTRPGEVAGLQEPQDVNMHCGATDTWTWRQSDHESLTPSSSEQELFETEYFCKDQDATLFRYARPLQNNPVVERFRVLAKELGVVLPISYFEQAGNAHFNSLVVIDSDGQVLKNYRKSHIPDGPGYQEKFYFTPGDTGFQVWETAVGKIGCAICWDQWFPEAARSMVMQGAEILLYPTAIGTEPPPAPEIDSSGAWRRVMQGHAAANVVPIVASNRVGREIGSSCELTFYGKSFITDETGEIAASSGNEDGAVILATFDLDAIRTSRHGWGLFRDRRPDLYARITTHG